MNKGIVSTGSKEATQAAADILRAGGNAFDAAVSAVFTSMTSEFALTGVGGGGAMMIQTPGTEPVLLDFFVDAPLTTGKEELDFFGVEVDFGDSTQIFHIGKGSAAVPGTLLGLVIAHQQYGILPLSVVMEPAINLARQGSVLNKKQAFIFKILKPIFSHSVEGQALFHLDGNILKEGDRFINSDFAEFLERVSWEGAAFFYLGEGAELIAKTFKDGGLLTEEVLSQYRLEIRKPIMTTFMDTQVYSNPAPSAGGTLIIFLLKLLSKVKNRNLKIPDLVKAMALTNIARKDICTDPNNENQINQLMEEEIFSVYLNKFHIGFGQIENNNPILGRGETTHVSVIDKDQNAASVTTTNGEGCGYILPNTGIMLNNMLGEEDLNPNGFHNWTHSHRLPTMISPTIVTKDGKPMIIVGSGGSNRIRSAMVQVLVNFILREMSIEESIEAPRIHLEGENLYFEPGINIPNCVFPGEVTLHPFDNKNLFFGGVNAVSIKDGFSDPRRGGTFEIV